MERILKFSSTFKALGDGKLELTASDESLDRDGDIIRAKGWDLKNFKKNPVILYAHDYSSLPVARAEKVWVEDGKLKSVIDFAPTQDAQDICALYEGGFLNAFSVGFVPLQFKDLPSEDAGAFPGREFTKQELLEISCVPVPSNPAAVQNAMSKGLHVPESIKELSETYFEAKEDLKEVNIPTQQELEDLLDEEPEPEEKAEDTPSEEADGDESEKDEANVAEKSGRVLNAANFAKLTEAQNLLQSALDSASPQDAVDEPEPDVPEESKDLDNEALATDKAFNANAFTAPLKDAIPKLVSEMLTVELRRLQGKIDD